METWKFLEDALALISDEAHWCPDGPGDGKETFCALMAIDPENQFEDDPSRFRAFELLEEIIGTRSESIEKKALAIAAFNDSSSHAEVCDLFRKAIAKAKQEAGIYLEVPKERVAA